MAGRFTMRRVAAPEIVPEAQENLARAGGVDRAARSARRAAGAGLQ